MFVDILKVTAKENSKMGLVAIYVPYYTYITSQVFNAGKKSAIFN